MQPSIAPLKPNLNTGPRPPGRKLTHHYNIGNKVVCQTEHRLTANTRFVELPLPVLHRLRTGVMR